MPKISEIDGKYSFSLVATLSYDLYRSYCMIISPGKLLFELLTDIIDFRKMLSNGPCVFRLCD